MIKNIIISIGTSISLILSVTKMPNALINSELMILNALAYQDSVAMDSRVKGK